MKETATSTQTRTKNNDSENGNESYDNRRNSNSPENQPNDAKNSSTSKMNGNGKSSEGKTSRFGNDGNTSNSSSSQNSNPKSGLATSQLMKLFEAELKDVYWAEKELTKAFPKMIKNATSEELIKALTTHLTETEEHVKRLENIFESIGKKPSARKCESMAGLIEEAEEIMEECDKGAMCDAGIIAAAQKVEHYEIATYGTLRQFAETLGLKDAEKFLAKTLKQEKASDQILTEIAVSVINIEAANQPSKSKK